MRVACRVSISFRLRETFRSQARPPHQHPHLTNALSPLFRLRASLSMPLLSMLLIVIPILYVLQDTANTNTDTNL